MFFRGAGYVVISERFCTGDFSDTCDMFSSVGAKRDDLKGWDFIEWISEINLIHGKVDHKNVHTRISLFTFS